MQGLLITGHTKHRNHGSTQSSAYEKLNDIRPFPLGSDHFGFGQHFSNGLTKQKFQ